MKFVPGVRNRTAIAAVLLAVGLPSVVVIALGTGRSFLYLESGYEQELYGAMPYGKKGDSAVVTFADF